MGRYCTSDASLRRPMSMRASPSAPVARLSVTSTYTGGGCRGKEEKCRHSYTGVEFAQMQCAVCLCASVGCKRLLEDIEDNLSPISLTVEMVAVSEAPCDLQWLTMEEAMVERKIKPASCTYSMRVHAFERN